MMGLGISSAPKSAAALATLLAIALGASGCGSGSSTPSAGASQTSSSSSTATQPTSVTSTSTSVTTTTSTSSATQSASAASHQNETPAEREAKSPSYVDPSITKYGKAASSGEAAEVTALVTGYYGALSSREYTKACALLSPGVQRTISRLLAASRGALKLKGCAGVLPALLGGAVHRTIPNASQVHVKSVRAVNGSAFAIIKTPMYPAAVVHVQKTGGTWRMGSLIATPAP